MAASAKAGQRTTIKILETAMMKRKEFEEIVEELFTIPVEGKSKPIKALSSIRTCLAIFREDNQWVSEDAVIEMIHGKPDRMKKSSQIEALRKNTSRIKEHLKKKFSQPDWKTRGFRISLAENQKKYGEGVPKDSRRREIKYFRFEFISEEEVKQHEGIKSYLMRFVGRAEEISLFQGLLDNLYSPKRSQHILSLYGFGGMGKSSLLSIFRDIAINQNIKIEPKHTRAEFVSGSISNWLSDVFIVQIREQEKFHQEKWRDFLEVLDPGTVVLIDTLAEVDMGEFNETLQSLAGVLKKTNPECLIVTATRAKPNHGEKTVEIKGLSADDIKNLVILRGWNPEITTQAKKLQKQTDGNPLLIEFICEDKDLWTRFKAGSLDLIRHSDRAAVLLNEMWNLLSQENKEALKILSLLSNCSAKWKFSWGKKESTGIIGPSWDEIAPELKAKCYIKEKEIDLYEMHDLISEFALTKITNKNELMEKMGDYFSSAGKEEIAIRFHAETSHAK